MFDKSANNCSFRSTKTSDTWIVFRRWFTQTRWTKNRKNLQLSERTLFTLVDCQTDFILWFQKWGAKIFTFPNWSREQKLDFVMQRFLRNARWLIHDIDERESKNVYYLWSVVFMRWLMLSLWRHITLTGIPPFDFNLSYFFSSLIRTGLSLKHFYSCRRVFSGPFARKRNYQK